MSRRSEQIASTLQRAVQEVIRRGFQDPRIRGLVTVTKVQPSPDLRSATVFISVYPEEHEKLTMHGLRSALPHIKHGIGDLIALRRTPDLVLKVDDSLKKQAVVYEALAKVEREREERGIASPDDEDATLDPAGGATDPDAVDTQPDAPDAGAEPKE